MKVTLKNILHKKNKNFKPNESKSIYKPNEIDAAKRTFCIVMSCLLIAYALASLVYDDFYLLIPTGGRGSGINVHLHGIPVWLGCIAIASACLSLLSVIADHYDTRNNEKMYKRFAQITLIIAFSSLTTAVISDRAYFKKGEYEHRGVPLPAAP